MAARSLHAIAFALGSLLAACGPQTYIIQQYDGPVREVEAIAILRINGSDPVRVLSLDGDYADPQLEEDTRLHIELLPGRHTVRVISSKNPGAGSQSLSFQAEAGRVYRAMSDPSFGAFAPLSVGPLAVDVFEVERGSDRPVRIVTLPLLAPHGVDALDRRPALQRREQGHRSCAGQRRAKSQVRQAQEGRGSKRPRQSSTVPRASSRSNAGRSNPRFNPQ